MNFARTMMLLAALTALFMGVGYLIGGTGGMLIALACLWISHHWLGYTSILADNVATNVVGLALAMGWRFWSYNRWVFVDRTAPASPEPVKFPVAEPAA